MDIHLECVDPAANRFRAYHVAIEADLFTEHALVVSWGRIGRPGRTRVVGSGDAATVRFMTERLLRLQRHGYVVVLEEPSSTAVDPVGLDIADFAEAEAMDLCVTDNENAEPAFDVLPWDAAERASL